MSFVDGFSEIASSTRPTRHIAPAADARTATRDSMRKTKTQMKRLAAIAAPPNIATGFLCQRSSRGFATKPILRATVRATGTRTSESSSASANGAATELVSSGTDGRHFRCLMVPRLRLGGPPRHLPQPALEADQRPEAMAHVLAPSL